jgi:hypothetical protein
VILVSEPGAIERVPLKVVPIFIDEPSPEPTHEPSPEPPTPDAAEPTPRAKTSRLGAAAVALAVLAGALQGVAIAVATGGDFGAATALAIAAIALAVLAVIAGIVAIVLNRGRRLGVAAVVVGVVANPWLLQGILRLVGG